MLVSEVLAVQIVLVFRRRERADFFPPEFGNRAKGLLVCHANLIAFALPCLGNGEVPVLLLVSCCRGGLGVA